MFSDFYKLAETVNDMEPSSEKPDEILGRNVNVPIKGGLQDFNDGVNVMMKFGNYEVPLNESIGDNYDINYNI